MYTIQQTQMFAKWFTALREARAKAAIILRLDRVRAGHLGDVKTLGNSVFELRVRVRVGKCFFPPENFNPMGNDKPVTHPTPINQRINYVCYPQ